MIKKTLAVMVLWLMVVPAAGATTATLLFNGQAVSVIDIGPENLVNKELSIIHDPDDFSWTNVRVKVIMNSAGFSHTIENVFLYVCKLDTPVNCIRVQPEVFETFVDAELPWRDISEQVGPGFYPERGGLMFLVKLRDNNNSAVWTGFFDTIERTAYNEFNVFSSDIPNVDFHVSSEDLITAITSFIEDDFMLPFNWATRIVFPTATKLFGLGGNTDELEESPPSFVGIETQVNEITEISKDFFILFPETSTGINNPVTLFSNALFTCGNGIAEEELGESVENCCYDVGCILQNEYCDLADSTDPSSGVCRDEDAISLQIISPPLITVTACGEEQSGDITVKVNNPPSNLATELTGFVVLGGQAQSITCVQTGGSNYRCPVSVLTESVCGSGSQVVEGGELSLSISYHDGPNVVAKDLSTTLADITVNYNCACAEGFYCDSDSQQCLSQDSITLTVVNVTSFIDDFNPTGDSIEVYAKIENAPADLTVNGVTAILGSIHFENTTLPGVSRSVGCQEGEGRVFGCSIPFTIPNYDNLLFYTIQDNSIEFSVSFDNEPGPRENKVLESEFSDVSVPGSFCGDGQVNSGETPETCCLDAGCAEGEFCDVTRGCIPRGDIELEFVSAEPSQFYDCSTEHTMNVRAKLLNQPTEFSLDFFYFSSNGVPTGWDTECEQISPGSGNGIISCDVTIPPHEGCTLPGKDLEQNSLTASITFDNGIETSPFYAPITMELTTAVPDVRIVPVYTCGNRIAEPDFGESAANCCVDNPCSLDPQFGEGYFCDVTESNPNGTCMSRTDVKLIVSSPTAPVHFSTCEVSNEVTIKTYVKNQPESLRVEEEFAIFNSSSAEDFRCSQDRVRVSNNLSFECTLKVPPIDTCTQGGQYSFRDNSIGFVVSYRDGSQGIVTQELTAPLPEIKITQSTRSLYDIFEEVKAEMDIIIDEVKDIADDMLEFNEKCMKITTILAFTGTFATIGGGVYAGFKEGIQSVSGVMSGLGAATGSIITAWSNFCMMVNKQYELAFQSQEMDAQLLEMEVCLEMVQQQIDNGMCREQGMNCFRELQECVNFGAVRSSMREAQSIAQESADYGQRIGRNLEQLGDALDRIDILGVDEGNFIVRWEGGTSNLICGYIPGVAKQRLPRTTPRYGSVEYEYYCEDSYVTIDFNGFDRCTRREGRPKAFLRETGGIYKDGDRELAWLMFGNTTGTYTFEVFCDRDNNDAMGENEKIREYQVKFMVGEVDKVNRRCGCSFNGSGFSSGAAAGPAATKITINRDEFPQDYTEDSVPISGSVTGTPTPTRVGVNITGPGYGRELNPQGVGSWIVTWSGLKGLAGELYTIEAIAYDAENKVLDRDTMPVKKRGNWLNPSTDTPPDLELIEVTFKQGSDVSTDNTVTFAAESDVRLEWKVRNEISFPASSYSVKLLVDNDENKEIDSITINRELGGRETSDVMGFDIEIDNEFITVGLDKPNELYLILEVAGGDRNVKHRTLKLFEGTASMKINKFTLFDGTKEYTGSYAAIDSSKDITVNWEVENNGQTEVVNAHVSLYNNEGLVESAPLPRMPVDGGPESGEFSINIGHPLQLGENFLTLAVRFDSERQRHKTLNMYDSSAGSLVVTNLLVNGEAKSPVRVPQGEDATVSYELKNFGDPTVTNVEVKLLVNGQQYGDTQSFGQITKGGTITGGFNVGHGALNVGDNPFVLEVTYAEGSVPPMSRLVKVVEED